MQLTLKEPVFLDPAVGKEVDCAPPHEFGFPIEKTVEKLRTLAAGPKVTVILPLTPVVGAEDVRG